MEIYNYFIGTPSLVDVENLRSNQCLQCFVRVNAPASQPHFYEHIQESKDVFQDKTYSYKVSFFMGIGHWEKHQVGVHWDNGIDCGYLYQSSPKEDFWVSLIEVGSN